MKSRRLLKAAEAVREVVSTTLLFHIRDPRVKNVTVLGADVAGDMRTAKVYVSVMGTPKQQSLCMHGLESAKGFIQSKIADRMQTRYTPVLKFVLDQGVKKSAETSQLLRDVLPGDEAADEHADEGEDAELDLVDDYDADDYEEFDDSDDESEEGMDEEDSGESPGR